ncbi:MAG: preprotein translocase subunit YajC [Oscillospiraceae bacterium]|nr:preprotein translocase subunit YajC [Oscillospiraceae bacterium]
MLIFTETATAGSGMGNMLLLLVVFGLMMFLMVIRPEKKKKKEEEALRASLQVGDRITTIGGIVGKIVHIDSENIVIETSMDQVRMELKKWSVMSNDTAAEKQKKARAEAQAAAREHAAQRKREKEDKNKR